MKTVTAVDATLFVLAMGVIMKLFAAMAHSSSLSLLSALPGEFQYLAAILF